METGDFSRSLLYIYIPENGNAEGSATFCYKFLEKKKNKGVKPSV
jgi:hypothetical protein